MLQFLFLPQCTISRLNEFHPPPPPPINLFPVSPIAMQSSTSTVRCKRNIFHCNSVKRLRFTFISVSLYIGLSLKSKLHRSNAAVTACHRQHILHVLFEFAGIRIELHRLFEYRSGQISRVGRRYVGCPTVSQFKNDFSAFFHTAASDNRNCTAEFSHISR